MCMPWSENAISQEVQEATTIATGSISDKLQRSEGTTGDICSAEECGEHSLAETFQGGHEFLLVCLWRKLRQLASRGCCNEAPQAE